MRLGCGVKGRVEMKKVFIFTHELYNCNMHVYAWIYNGIVKYQTHDFSSHMIFGNKKDNKMCVPSIYREFNDLKWINETCFNIMCISPFHLLVECRAHRFSFILTRKDAINSPEISVCIGLIWIFTHVRPYVTSFLLLLVRLTLSRKTMYKAYIYK